MIGESLQLLAPLTMTLELTVAGFRGAAHDGAGCHTKFTGSTNISVAEIRAFTQITVGTTCIKCIGRHRLQRGVLTSVLKTDLAEQEMGEPFVAMRVAGIATSRQA